MRRLSFCIMIGTLVLMSLAGVGQAYPNWPEDLGVDFWRLPTLNQELSEYRRCAEELDIGLKTTNRRVALKEDIATALIAGNTTLRDATVAFRNLNAQNPQYMPLVRLQFPGASDTECHFRGVLEYVRVRTLGAPDGAQTVARLQRDLEQARQLDGGSLRLPD